MHITGFRSLGKLPTSYGMQYSEAIFTPWSEIIPVLCHPSLFTPLSLTLFQSSLEPALLIRSDRRWRGGHQFDGKMRERKMHRRSFMPMAFRRTQVTLPKMERAEIWSGCMIVKSQKHAIVTWLNDLCLKSLKLQNQKVQPIPEPEKCSNPLCNDWNGIMDGHGAHDHVHDARIILGRQPEFTSILNLRN